MLPKQLNSWDGNVTFKNKRQPRLGLLCQLCTKSARKQGHSGEAKLGETLSKKLLAEKQAPEVYPLV